MRSVISYDDIIEPTTITTNGNAAVTAAGPQAEVTQLGPQLPSTHKPPTKRRRTNQSRSQANNRYSQNKSQQRRIQHWDEPGSSNLSMSYGGDDEETEGAIDENAVEGEDLEDGEELEESRELTHEEVWDDSALIDAWNSASAEYEAYHGTGDKSWQNEPLKKSPLWYNIPPDLPEKSKGKGVSKPSTVSPANGVIEPVIYPATAEENDSQPQDFNTYVPSHDPSLTPLHPPGVPGPDYAQYFVPPLQGPMVNQDEAFQRAMSAMYWGGYWTAVYHYNRQTRNEAVQETITAEVENDDDEMKDEDDDEGFMASQR